MMKFGLALGAALMLAPVPAQAAVTVTDYAFTNSFAIGLYPTLSGTFSLSHDSDSGVYALTALNYVVEGFTHDVSNSFIGSYFDGKNDRVAIYGNVNDNIVYHHTNDFDLVFAVGGRPNQASSVYSTPTAFIIPSAATIVTVLSTPAVPEPASWMLMIAGFATAGHRLRRRKTILSYAF